jgi:hypothetical protein
LSTTLILMTRDRRTRLRTVFLALVSLLFMQLAVASYACPGAQSSRIAEVAAMAEAEIPCAETMSLHMDGEQPHLCQAHCQASHQTADKYELPALASAALADIAYTPFIAPAIPEGAPAQAPLLKRTTAPPLAVQHCCFRI